MDPDLQRLVHDLMNSRSFDRIKKVSFLGIVDRENQQQRGGHPSFSRAEHSLGVLRLGAQVALRLQMPVNDAAHLLAACLVHDLGHPPFSHSLEYAFPKRLRAVGHHEVLREMLLNPMGYEQEISRILTRHHVSPQRIYDIVDGVDDLSFFFTSPLNIDTLDGINRSMVSFGIFPSYKADLLTNITADIYAGCEVSQEKTLMEMDRFWENKNLFYKILSSENVLSLAERKFQKAARLYIGILERSHFRMTDDQFISRYPQLMSSYGQDVGPETSAASQAFVVNRVVKNVDKRSISERYIRIKNAAGGVASHAPQHIESSGHFVRSDGRLRKDMPHHSDVSVVVNGSLARGEVTSQSDFDAYPLHATGAEQVASELFAEVKERAGLKEFAAEGAFGDAVSASSVRKNIGGQKDDNLSFTRRMLLLLESSCLGAREVYDETIDGLVKRYINDDITNKQIGRFLLNDFIRFYRTMCVDFEFKTVEQTKPWGVRYTKLIFSRKLIYFSGVVMCAELAGKPARQKRELLINFINQPPIDRLIEVLGESIVPALTEYDYFLGMLDDISVRDDLGKVEMLRSSHTELFKEIKIRGHAYSAALVSALNLGYPSSHPIHEALSI